MNVAVESINQENLNYKGMADAIRALSMDAVQKANSGHPGMPMGMADVATVLFANHLKFNPKDPAWFDRDRFILSAGHGSMLQYSLMYLSGYEDISIDDIKNFRQLHSPCCGHPEFGEARGIETTTGPLGQGISMAVGFAIAEANIAKNYGTKTSDHYTYTIAGDGCLMEGISQEAISLAGHLKLNKLVVLWDDNEITIDGAVSNSSSENQRKRFEAAGWDTWAIDGHNFDEINEAIAQAKLSDKPALIACRTTIAKGSPNKGGTAASHGAPLGDDEIALVRETIGWEHASFEVPSDILNSWRSCWLRNEAEYKNYEAPNFDGLEAGAIEALSKLKKNISDNPAKIASRKASQNALEVIVPEMKQNIIGGSADLTGSNLTKVSDSSIFDADERGGNYIYYGVREHGMAAAMNGISLHGGLRAYGGTFFVFTDYCRPSIRLSALMNQGVVYVMTHDSIGLGEDGPTHQPVEHLASLRAMPNVNVLRPADAYETAECWQIALQENDKPSILVLSRQGLEPTGKPFAEENRCAKGAYVIGCGCSEGKPEVVILSSGSEVGIAKEAMDKLNAEGIKTRVVSVPSFRHLDVQGDAYLKDLIPENAIKVAIEAGVRQGWDRYIGSDGIFVGMEGFGLSAPANDLYNHFGISVENVINKVKAKRS